MIPLLSPIGRFLPKILRPNDAPRRRLHYLFFFIVFFPLAAASSSPPVPFLSFFLCSAAHHLGTLGPPPRYASRTICPYLARTCTRHPETGSALRQGDWKAKGRDRTSFPTYRYPGGAGSAWHATGGVWLALK
ncbi:hypothetical protein B0J12DRAFT_448907 [Macrophomina phaseolina]|uniref:Uncharacterized protein n=1 Tax=Macrophomina phaseolina TaxID=35725 RepID=A0ABQ8GHR2_9PEZI|nr:hypothetical protein B0J12DRAFT_448907 [Macrophomina phaseolina]